MIRSKGYFLRDTKTDLGRIFQKNMLKKNFAKESPQIRARKWLQLKTTTVLLCPTTPKRASANERAIKEGGRGATPRDSLRPGFL